MRKLLPILVLITTASIAGSGPAAAEMRSSSHLLSPSSASFGAPSGAFVLVGGMGGGGMGMGMGMGGGGGMGGGMGGGGPGSMMGGGMSSGGMGAAGGGIPGYGTMPSGGAGLPYGGGDTTDGATGGQPVQYFQCVTQYGQCSLASSTGAVRSGGACTCTNGRRGKVK
jgi:hypothetical protein